MILVILIILLMCNVFAWFSDVPTHRGLQCICAGKMRRKLGGDFSLMIKMLVMWKLGRDTLTRMGVGGLATLSCILLRLVHTDSKRKFQQIYISRCRLMEKSPQCRTSSRTHLLLSKEPRAPICQENWPPRLRQIRQIKTFCFAQVAMSTSGVYLQIWPSLSCLKVLSKLKLGVENFLFCSPGH